MSANSSITAITSPPADLLAALKAYLSPNAIFDVYRVKAGGKVTTRALIGKAGHIIVYLVPANTTLLVGNILPDGVAMPSTAGASLAAADNNSITRATGVTPASEAVFVAALHTYLGVSGTYYNAMTFNGVANSNTPISMTTPDTSVGAVFVYPQGFVYQQPLQASTSSSSSSALVYLGLALVLVLALGGGAWWYIRNKQSKENHTTTEEEEEEEKDS
jgi:hypothetical protein